MDTSVFLSRALGLYLIIVSVAFAIHMPQFIALVDAFATDAPLVFVTAIFTLILGILLVVAHNHWQWHWRLIITIIAWLTLIKGISMMLYPDYISHMNVSILHEQTYAYIAVAIDFILGLILCYFGFRRRVVT